MFRYKIEGEHYAVMHDENGSYTHYDATMEEIEKARQEGYQKGQAEVNYSYNTGYTLGYEKGLEDAMRWRPVSEKPPKELFNKEILVKFWEYDRQNLCIGADIYSGIYNKWCRFGGNVQYWMPIPEVK
jgi:hypothetical protein